MSEQPTPSTDGLTKWLVVGTAMLTAAAGVLRIWNPYGVKERLDRDTLIYFCAAGVLLMLRDVRSLALGDYKVEFERTRQLAADAKATAENAQATAVGAGIGTPSASIARKPVEPQPGPDPDDPWKGVFGGASTAYDRRIEAHVDPLDVDGQLFAVRLHVISTDPAKPLRDAVQFFLHPTFPVSRPVVTVGPRGTADLSLRAYGAFTVGVLADGGKTRLELDLAELPSAPLLFRQR